MALITSQVSNVGKSGDAGSSNTQEIIDGIGVNLTQTGQTITMDMVAPNTATYTVKGTTGDVAVSGSLVETDYVGAFNTTSGLIYYIWGFWNVTSTTSGINLVAKINTVSGTLADIDIALAGFRGTTSQLVTITGNNTFSSALTITSTTMGVQIFGNFRCTASGSAKIVIRQSSSNTLNMPYINGTSYIYVYGYDPSTQNVYIDDNWGVDLA